MITSPYYLPLSFVSVSAAVNLFVTATSFYRRDQVKRNSRRLRQCALAYSVDIIILAVITTTLAWTFGEGAALVAPFLFVITAVVYPTAWYLISGFTPGQRLARIRRTFIARRHLTVGLSVLGFLCMVFGFPLGFLPMLLDAKGRTVEEILSQVMFGS